MYHAFAHSRIEQLFEIIISECARERMTLTSDGFRLNFRLPREFSSRERPPRMSVPYAIEIGAHRIFEVDA